jgi:hypothetical protein
MKSFRVAVRVFVVAMMAGGAGVLAIAADGPGDFVPDGVFKGSTLTGWKVMGEADWKAVNGELVATPRPGGAGGWLVMDKGFQDVQLYTDYKCTGTCQAGVVLRAAKTPNGGFKGIYVSLTNGELGNYIVTVDNAGRILSKNRIEPPAARGAGAGAAPAAGGGAGRAAGPPPLKTGEWNPIDILVSVTNLRTSSGGNIAVDDESAASFGPVALHVAAGGEVRFKAFSWKDLNGIVEQPEQVGARYTAQRISNLYYGWSAAGADFNKDGRIDLASGPFYYLGPTFTERRIFRAGRVYNPSTEYAPDMVNLAADFTGDGWPDILASEMQGGRPMDLYVNPAGEARRWDKFRVLPTVSTEIVVLKDLDKDGKPEVVFGGGGVYAWARPDPANPTAAWTSHPISVQGKANVPGHGIGIGDVNSDGRLDLVGPFGWFEQPAAGITASPWTFHAVEFGNNAVFGNGGGEYGVYDINGDGLTDVIGGQAHNWGMNWYEQKKSADGSRTFVTHPIMFNFASENAGNVVFSEGHASRIADMTGDGIPDFVTGKRYWAHLENYNGPDPYGPAVVYIYRTVRDPKAPGGARFAPELVHNKSGVGSSFEVMDINRDGTPDIATQGAFGTYVFLSKPRGR